MDKENLEDEDLQNAEENEEEDEGSYEDGEDEGGEGEEPREGDDEENEDDDHGVVFRGQSIGRAKGHGSGLVLLLQLGHHARYPDEQRIHKSVQTVHEE